MTATASTRAVINGTTSGLTRGTIAGPSPLDYEAALRFYWDARQGATLSGGTITQWAAGKGAVTLTVPATFTAPTYSSNGINNLPSVTFDTVDDCLGDPNNSATLLNIWHGSGIKRLSFVFRLNTLRGAGVNHFLFEKASSGAGTNIQGWRLTANVGGALQFVQETSDALNFDWTLAGAVASGSLVVGSMQWDGDVTSAANVKVRLYDSTTGQFTLRSPVISTQVGKVIGSDAGRAFLVGNNATFDSEWIGPACAFWFTNPAPQDYLLDDAIMSEWIA